MFKNLQLELSRKGITHSELAKALDISKSKLVNKLNGKTEFLFEEAIKIVQDIFSGEYDLKYLFRSDSQLS